VSKLEKEDSAPKALHGRHAAHGQETAGKNSRREGTVGAMKGDRVGNARDAPAAIIEVLLKRDYIARQGQEPGKLPTRPSD